MAVNNVLLTPTLFAKLVLVGLGDSNGLKVVRGMNRSYEMMFGKKGNKPGDFVNVRKPQRFTVSHKLEYDPQGITNIKVPVAVSRISQIGYEWDSKEKTLFVPIEDAMNLYAKPAATALANDFNATAAQFIAQNSFNFVGTPGTTPTTLAAYLEADDLMVAQGAPQNDTVRMIVNRKMSSKFVDARGNYFNPTAQISKQIQEGEVQSQLGYEWEIDETIYKHTVGALGGTPLVDGTSAANLTAMITTEGNNSTMTVVVKGAASSITNWAKAGDKFVIDGIHSVHPQTRQDTGYNQCFTVLQDCTSVGTAATLLVAPGLTPSGQYQNVTRAAVDSDSILFWGAATASAANAYAGKTFPCGLAFRKDAFTFLSVPLDNPEPGMGALVKEVTDPATGVSISILKSFDGVNRKEINRLDSLWDVAWLYRELACVVVGG